MKRKVCIIHKVQQLNHRSFYKQGLALIKAGYDVTILSFYEKEEVIEGINLVKFKRPAQRLIRLSLTNLAIFIKALKEKADIYQFHDLDFVPWAILLKLISRKKIIYNIHEAYPEYMLIKPYIPKYLKKIISKLIYILEHLGSLLFDAIITNDNFVLKDFNHKQKEVIYNFPILDFLNFDRELPYEKRLYDIIFIGSLPSWHFEPMLDISEILKEKGYHVKWLLLPAKDAPREWMISQIKERNLSDYFTVAETAPFKSVPQFLYNSRIGIITIPPYEKYLKNIPLKMFEYMGCGLPVIANDLPPIRQFVEGEDCAILVKHEPMAYANAIMSLIDDPKKAIKMGERGKKLVYERYNWNTEEKKLLNIYAELMQNGERYSKGDD